MRAVSRVMVLALVCGGLAGAGGCGALGLSGRSQPKEFRIGPGKVSPAEVQAELMAFVDTFSGTMSQQYSTAVQGVQDAANAGGAGDWKPTQDDAARARRASVESRLAIMSSIMNVAASPNPYVGVADLITSITLTRMSMEGSQTAKTYGAEGQRRLVEAMKAHEERAWRIAEKVYTPQQQQELRELILDWRKKNPDARWVASVRLEDFAKDRLTAMTGSGGHGTSVLSLLGIDPLAGLDPAAREVEKSRMLAERMFFYASRSPALIKLQTESLLSNVVRNPEVKDTLDSLERISKAAENLSLEAAALPANLEKEREETLKQAFAQIREERQATIEQIFDGLTEQRQALMRDLDTQQGGLQTTSKEIRTTIDSAKGAIDSAKELTASVQEILTEARAFSTTVVPTPTTPINVVDKEDRDVLKDYASAVDKTGATLDQLAALTTRVESLMASPQLEKQVQTVQIGVEKVEESSKDVIDYAFWRLLILVLVTPVATGAAVVAVRKMSARPRP